MSRSRPSTVGSRGLTAGYFPLDDRWGRERCEQKPAGSHARGPGARERLLGSPRWAQHSTHSPQDTFAESRLR